MSLLPKHLKSDEDANAIPPTEIIKTLERVVASEKDKRELINSLHCAKRPNWSRGTNMPYYREKYGIVAKMVLDMLVKAQKPFCYYYRDYPNEKHATVYLRFMQGKMYLLDYLDPDGTYCAVNKVIFVEKRRGLGVWIEIRKDLVEDVAEDVENPYASLLPKQVAMGAAEWREQIEIFLNSEDGDNVVLEINDCALSNVDVGQLESELCALADIHYTIRHDRIKIVKILPEKK